MKLKKLLKLTISASILFSSASHALNFYTTGFVGYGSTLWSFLAADCSTMNSNECVLISGSAPIETTDRGNMWGVGFGYELNQNFSLEFSYAKFKDSDIKFDIETFYDEALGDDQKIISKTNAYIVQGKFFAPITPTLRVFSGAGLSFTQRKDKLANLSEPAPAFSVGLNYRSFTNRIILEGSFQYISGKAEASVRPAENYLPFLCFASVKVGYLLF